MEQLVGHESMEELLKTAPQEQLKEGKVIQGKVIRIKKDYILLDIGAKVDGVVPFNECIDKDGELNFKQGDIVDVFLKKKENQTGNPVLSYKKACEIRQSQRIRQAYKKGLPIKGKILRSIPGGLIIDIGKEAFMPASHTGEKNPDALVGQSILVKIIEMENKDIVVSRREYLKEEKERQKRAALARIKEGDICKGTIKTITDFGAFIDIGGIDGLLHIGDLSWGRVEKVSDILKLGEEIEVKVLKVNPEKQRIALGLKQLIPHPWANINQKYAIDSIVEGRVTSVTNFGAFVELEPGVEGLIHVSEMSWTEYVTHPSKVVSVNDLVQARVLKIDRQKKQIWLGLKQIKPNPWLLAQEKYPPGTKVTGTVSGLFPFGAFVRLEEGIDGIIRLSDLSWTEKPKHPKQILSTGQKVQAVVLEVDPGKRKIGLGLKQVKDDPFIKYSVGDYLKVKITRFADFGVFVRIEKNIEGFIHRSQISSQKIENPQEKLQIGHNIMAKIVKVDLTARQIELSIKEYEKDQKEKEIQKYIAQSESKTTLGDVLGDDVKKFFKK